MTSHYPAKLDDKIYRSLCLAISERADQVEWEQFESEDWENLYQTANKERVGPVLYWSLNHSYSPSNPNIPALLLSRLRSLYFSVWVHNLDLYQELSPLLEVMVNAGIQVVVLKGISLASSLYQNVGMRPMGDLDLLVHNSQLGSAVQIAQTFGYIDSIPNIGREVKNLLAYNIHLNNINNPKTILEIHTSLIGSEAFNYAVPMDWFWEQTELHSWKYKGIGTGNEIIQIDNVYKFAPAAQVIYLSAHAMLQHGLREIQLIWLYDIHKLVVQHGSQIDWKFVILQAKKMNWDPALFSALKLSKALFNTPIPSDVLSILINSSKIELNDIINIKSTPTETRMMSEWRKLNKMKWNARIRLVSALLFPSPAYMRWRYRTHQSWTLPYFYIRRWIGILMDGANTLLNLARSNT